MSRRKGSWSVIIVSAAIVVVPIAGLGAAVLLFAPRVLNPRAHIELDGSRDLGDGYKLWMLKGYPTFIQPVDTHASEACVPPERPDPSTASHEVDRYARLNSNIFVVATGYEDNADCATRYFAIDTAAHRSTELKDRAAFELAIRAAGASIDSLNWREAVPGG